MSEMKRHLMLLAAGTGSRAGHDIPKQFVTDRHGASLLAHSLEKATRSVRWDSITVAVPLAYKRQAKEILRNASQSDAHVVAGADDRMDSLRQALLEVDATRDEVCVVHDGVRPFTPPELFAQVTDALEVPEVDACWPMSSPRDTVIVTSPDADSSIVPAPGVSIAATPIAVRYDVLIRALNVESPVPGILIDRILRLGARWKHVDNPWWNLKVTTRRDLETAMAILDTEVR